MKMNANHLIKIGCILIFVFLFTGSCHINHSKADISDIATNIKIIRFEQDLFAADPTLLEMYIPVWKKEYGKLFSHFCYVTHLGDPEDPLFAARLKAFVTDFNNYRLYKRTMEVFPDLDHLTADLNKAFRYYRYYFPDKPLPAIYTYISGLNQAAVTDDSLLAIGLDHFLGKDEAIYSEAGFYNYLIVKMVPEQIVPNCMSFWAETEFAYNDSVDNLITNMLFRGRLMYFTNALLPDQPDSVKWGFSAGELKYMNTAEKSMWAFLIEHKLLFNTDKFTIDKFILEGPFTKDFGRESPARAAIWIGYRIVEAYMHQNQSVTLQDLMKEKDYSKILNLSGYNP
jgi:hypothetical protein